MSLAVVSNQARDDVGRYEHLKTIAQGGTSAEAALNDVDDIRDVTPLSTISFTSPSPRLGWPDQPADVSTSLLLTR